ncbi:MAG: tetratricopeptide repeat protein [Acidobacteriota bacterium]
MRLRTFIGILVALSTIVAVAYLTNQNIDLLGLPFKLAGELHVPLYAALLTVFLLGFLPVVILLLVQTLKQDLSRRRQRRFERESQSWQMSFRRAVDLQADGQWLRAADELERVLADQPDDFSTLLGYGNVLRRCGRHEDALEVLRRASVLYPQSTAVLLQLIEVYEARGESEVAAQIQERLLRDFPGSGVKILRRRRDEALARGDWASCRATQDRLDSLLPSTSETIEPGEVATRHILRYQEGVAFLEREKYQESQQIFQQLIDEHPDSVPARMMLAEVALRSGHASEALRRWRETYDRTGSAAVLQRIEDHFIEREQPLEAIEMLRAIIATADDDLLPRFFLGQLYARLEMHREAMGVLDGIRSRAQDSAAYLRLLAELKIRMGEKEAASEAFRASIERLGLSNRRYVCGACRSITDSWNAICHECGTFGLIDLQVELVSEPNEEVPPIHPVAEVSDDRDQL